MNKCLKASITILIISVVSFVWSRCYIQANKAAGFASLFGLSNPMYQLAVWVGIGSVALFIIGVGLLIGGVVQKNGNTKE